MLKIKLVENFRHRNETTFRPYLMCADLFEDIGIQFVFEGKYDLAWVGQATIADKNYALHRANFRGRWFIENTIHGDFILFDGQDSPSLIGTYHILTNTKAKLLLKNSLYRNRSDYSTPSIHGRTYWGSSNDYPGQRYQNQIDFGTWNAGNWNVPSDYDFSINDIKFDRVKLSGSNWLSTLNPTWFDIRDKDIDVFAVFQYPAKYNEEFGKPTNQFYDAHRKRCVDWIDMLPKSIKVAKLENGNKIPIEQYYELMKRSKIVVAPFGYGEMAPRDIEAAMVNAILIKPDMGHIESIPNSYIPDVTYRPCKWDFSNLNDIITDTLDNYSANREKFVNNARLEYERQYAPEKLVTHIHGIISEIDGYGTV